MERMICESLHGLILELPEVQRSSVRDGFSVKIFNHIVFGYIIIISIRVTHNMQLWVHDGCVYARIQTWDPEEHPENRLKVYSEEALLSNPDCFDVVLSSVVKWLGVAK